MSDSAQETAEATAADDQTAAGDARAELSDENRTIAEDDGPAVARDDQVAAAASEPRAEADEEVATPTPSPDGERPAATNGARAGGDGQPPRERASRRITATPRRPAAQPTSPATPPPVAANSAGDEPFVQTFEDLGLGGALLRSVRDVGYEEPTPIQIQTIPLLLEGRDVIAQAQTGSGKTAAFGLPIIETVDPRLRQVQALILCPTRELAIQVSEALHKYGRHKEVETLPIYGGQPYERQFRGLQRGVQIVVGTPGRVMDHMRRGTLTLDAIRFFVLDEADEMLDMGFIEDIEWILESAPTDRQTALFSATIPPRIADLAQRYMRDPVRITIAGKEMTVPQTRQSSYEVPRSRKVDALTRILDAETPTSAMIFCRTKNGVDELGEALMARGYAVETLHGDLSQAQRDRVMRRFRSGQADILIATDVAARGLDIPDVSHVFNFDIPESAEGYVHRIGRTGRAGRAGDAITLVTPRETRWLRQIERTTRARIDARRLPTLADVAERRREAMKQQILAVLNEEESYSQYIDTVDDLADDHETVAVAAAILKLYADETGRSTTPEQQEDDVATFSAATGAGRGPRGESGMIRLFLNVGRQQGVRPQDIVGAIANEAGIPGRAIGAIDILDAYTFVDIPHDFVDRVIAALRTAKIKGRPVNAEVARPDGTPSDRRPGGFDRGDGGPGFDRRGRQQFDRGDRFGGGPRRDGDRGGYPRRDAPSRRAPFVGGVRVGPPGDEGGDRGGGQPFEPSGPRRFDRAGPGRFRERRDGGNRG